MKQIGLLLAAGTVFLASGVQAQDRKIQEEWIVHDPTIAEEGNWVGGFSADYWTFWNQVAYESASGKSAGTSTTFGDRFGGSLRVGYDNWMGEFSYKQGSFTHLETIGADTRADIDSKQYVLKGRYLFRDTEIMGGVPYFLLGYEFSDIDSDRTMQTAGWVFTKTGTANIKHTTKIHAIPIGIGEVWPFGDSGLGIRADISGGPAWGTRDYDQVISGYSKSESGAGAIGRATATVYWDIFEGLNLQVGGMAEGQYLQLPGYDSASFGGGGFFAQLGYSIRF